MASFAKRLLAWYDEERRHLPWRGQRDPWLVWVSEVMLHQTRVAAALAAFSRFTATFPTPQSLAAASDDELLAAWRGLGYYRRARLLRDAARTVVERHDGRVPASSDQLAKLPGVGEYTAGAVASIAFGEAVPAVDGNVERIMARHLALEGNVKSRRVASAIRRAVAARMPPERAGDFNQALMDLGAAVCTPRRPKCAECPIRADCRAHGAGIAERLPQLPARRPAVEVLSRAVLVPMPDSRVLGCRIPDGEINAGQVDLPGAGLLVAVESSRLLAATLERRFGLAFDIGPVVATVHHGITHHRIRLIVHEARCERAPGPHLLAARPDDAQVPWSTAARKAFRQASLFLKARG